MSLLLVEDNAADARLVRELLLEARPHLFDVTHVTDLRSAVASLTGRRFDVIILDLGLPDSTGLETLVRARGGAPDVPVIVLTGLDDEGSAINAVSHGAQDYLVKGAVTGQVLRHAITYAIERARLEATTREREDRFRQLTDNMKEVFFVVDSQFRETLYISPAYEDVWGWPCASLYERPASFLEHIVAEDREAVRANIARVQAGEDAGEIMFRITRADGAQRSILTHAMPVRDADGVVYRIAGLGMDVTERLSLERQFRQAQKMEAVGRLAGGVAHDFNNLLTVITSYTSLLLSEAGLGDAVRDDLAQIAKAAESAATLTRQLLAFSRQQVVEPRVLDLNDVVRDAGKILRRVIGEDVALVMKLAPDLGRVLADFGQIEQIIMNMTVNARDAMPSGGRLVLETANVEI
ncbi:MAG TPA: response regulator, partial [Gemmatimonadaceae bacterium]|nr:response regulator [Gemmatimonadaceae bacterium]